MLFLASYVRNPFRDEKDRLFVLVLSFLCFVYVLPIIMANRYYVDDLGRSMMGYTRWAENGRPLADILMKLFGFTGRGERIVDLFPLTLLMAVAAFVYFSFCYYRAHFDHGRPILAALLLFFPFINPFFLENLSYRFDSLTMMLSLVLVMAAYLEREVSWRTMVIASLLFFLSLCLYQAVIGFFVILAMIEALLAYCDRQQLVMARSILRALFARVVQLLLAYLLYALLIKPKYAAAAYTAKHSELLTPNLEGLHQLWQHMLFFNDKIAQSIADMPLFIPAYLMVATLGTLLWLIRVRHRLLAERMVGGALLEGVLSVGILLSPALAFVMSFLPLSVFTEPVTFVRVLISYSGFLLWMAVVLLLGVGRWRLAPLLALPAIWFALIFSYAYGTAMGEQKIYDQYLATNIAAKIHEADPKVEKRLFLYGAQRVSPVLENAASRYRLIGDLVPVYLKKNWNWGVRFLNHFGVENLWADHIEDEILPKLCTLTPIYQSRDFSLLETGDVLILALQPPACGEGK